MFESSSRRPRDKHLRRARGSWSLGVWQAAAGQPVHTRGGPQSSARLHGVRLAPSPARAATDTGARARLPDAPKQDPGGDPIVLEGAWPGGLGMGREGQRQVPGTLGPSRVERGVDAAWPGRGARCPGPERPARPPGPPVASPVTHTSAFAFCPPAASETRQVGG